MYRNHHNSLGRIRLVFSACAATALVVPLFAAPPANQAASAHRGRPGAVYTMSNAAEGNEILAYGRAADGSLMWNGTYATGGLGTGEGLGNQGGVVLSEDHHRLYVVNAGSNDISAFDVTPQGLALTDVEPSLGARPVSVAVSGGLLYVLNAGGAGSIHGFTVSDDGDIMPIADSMRPLSGAEVTAAAQVGFTPDGGVLVVTEKATSLIDTYVVHEDGTTSGPFVLDSSGQTPFGFDFTSRGSLLVSEAFGGAPGMAAASSYSVAADGTLEVISGTVQSFQTAACWLVVNVNSRHAYTTNTPAGTISGYVIDAATDSIELLDEDGVTFDVGEGTGPLDAAFSTNGRFLYVLNSGSHEIGVFRVHKNDGSLTAIQTVPGLPETANGMAAH
jgi:6-phosphogluconolactonase (cycloisomerase 2 family)